MTSFSRHDLIPLDAKTREWQDSCLRDFWRIASLAHDYGQHFSAELKEAGNWKIIRESADGERIVGRHFEDGDTDIFEIGFKGTYEFDIRDKGIEPDLDDLDSMLFPAGDDINGVKESFQRKIGRPKVHRAFQEKFLGNVKQKVLLKFKKRDKSAYQQAIAAVMSSTVHNTTPFLKVHKGINKDGKWLLREAVLVNKAAIKKADAFNGYHECFICEVNEEPIARLEDLKSACRSAADRKKDITITFEKSAGLDGNASSKKWMVEVHAKSGCPQGKNFGINYNFSTLELLEVYPGMWADTQTDLRRNIGDRLVKINDTPVSNSKEWKRAKEALSEGDDVVFTIAKEDAHIEAKNRNFKRDCRNRAIDVYLQTSVPNSMANAVNLWLSKKLRHLTRNPLKPARVDISGHCIGGAFTILAAASIRCEFPTLRIRAVTWGSPKVGDANFAKFYNQFGLADVTVRLVCGADPMPSLPSKKHWARCFLEGVMSDSSDTVEYKHVCEEISLQDRTRGLLNGSEAFSLSLCHEMEYYYAMAQCVFNERHSTWNDPDWVIIKRNLLKRAKTVLKRLPKALDAWFTGGFFKELVYGGEYPDEEIRGDDFINDDDEALKEEIRLFMGAAQAQFTSVRNDVEELRHETHESYERSQALLSEQRQLLESIRHTQGDKAGELMANLESMADVKSKNEYLLERTQQTLEELKHLHFPAGDDLQRVYSSLQGVQNEISMSYEACTSDIHKLRKEQKKHSNRICDTIQGLESIIMNNCQVQELSSQIDCVHSALDKKLEKLCDMELVSEDNFKVLEKMDSIGKMLGELSIDHLCKSLYENSQSPLQEDFYTLDQLIKFSTIKMDELEAECENCKREWERKANQIAWKVARDNTNKFQKIISDEGDSFQQLRMMAIDCQVWSTIFGDCSLDEGSLVYERARNIQSETARAILNFLTKELASPPKMNSSKDTLFRPKTK